MPCVALTVQTAHYPYFDGTPEIASTGVFLRFPPNATKWQECSSNSPQWVDLLYSKQISNGADGTKKDKQMKIHQYNQRIQYWYDRTDRTWYCQQNDINGITVDRRDESGYQIPAMTANTKSDCLENCQELENELKQQ